jgi:hypothetical protein
MAVRRVRLFPWAVFKIDNNHHQLFGVNQSAFDSFFTVVVIASLTFKTAIGDFFWKDYYFSEIVTLTGFANSVATVARYFSNWA